MPSSNALSLPDAAPKTAKSDKANRGELDSISIRFAENGAMVTCSFEPAKPTSEKVPYPDPEVRVFLNAESLAAYVAQMAKDQFDYEADEE